MSVDQRAILGKLDLLKRKLDIDWKIFTGSEANLRRVAMDEISCFFKSMGAVAKQNKNKESTFYQDLERATWLTKIHDPLPAYYHKEEVHFKDFKNELIKHIERAERAVSKGKTGRFQDIIIDAKDLKREIHLMKEDDLNYLRLVMKVRNETDLSKSSVKEFLKDAYSWSLWQKMKPYFKSHIYAHSTFFIRKGFYNGRQNQNELSNMVKKRESFYNNMTKMLDELISLIS